ncbi:MAG: CBS domain-containing protein [Pirellulaceae bacterium]
MATTKTDMPMMVSSVMQRRLVKVNERDTIQKAVDKLTENHLSALPVVNEEDELVGILSVSDLLRLVQDAERTLEDNMSVYGDCYWLAELVRDMLGDDDVASAMTETPFTARQDDPLQEVARLMLEHQIHHVPITSDGKQLVGMVSSVDFVRLAATPS